MKWSNSTFFIMIKFPLQFYREFRCGVANPKNGCWGLRTKQYYLDIYNDIEEFLWFWCPTCSGCANCEKKDLDYLKRINDLKKELSTLKKPPEQLSLFDFDRKLTTQERKWFDIQTKIETLDLLYRERIQREAMIVANEREVNELKKISFEMWLEQYKDKCEWLELAYAIYNNDNETYVRLCKKDREKEINLDEIED